MNDDMCVQVGFGVGVVSREYWKEESREIEQSFVTATSNREVAIRRGEIDDIIRNLIVPLIHFSPSAGYSIHSRPPRLTLAFLHTYDGAHSTKLGRCQSSNSTFSSVRSFFASYCTVTTKKKYAARESLCDLMVIHEEQR